MPSPSDPDNSSGPSTEELFEQFLEHHDERDEVAFERLCGKHVERSDSLRRLRSLWLRFSGAVDGLGGLDDGPQAEGRGSADAAGKPTTQALEFGHPDESLEHFLQRLGPGSTAGKHLSDRREIARGGMGRILRTWDNSLRRTLAMKVLLGTRLDREEAPEDDHERRQLSRFLEEAQITGQLDHPGIVPVHELGIDDEGQVYFTMRLVRGRSLRTVFELMREGHQSWTVTRALGVLLKVCHAVAFAHSKGVIHRDLKPANIMVGRFGETYVMDWGLAKVVGREDTHDLRPRPETTNVSVVSTDRGDLVGKQPESPLLTMDGTVVGTPAYMSPEQARGLAHVVGPQTDVYSVGAMLYQLLTAQKPYVAPDEHPRPRAVLEELLNGPPTPVLHLARKAPPELVAICDKAMARNVDARYPDLSAMAAELDAFIEGRVVAAYSTGAFAQLKKWVGRHRAVAGLMLMVVAAITIALIFTLDLNTDLQLTTAQLRQRESELESAVQEATTARQAAEDQTAAKDVALDDRRRAQAFAERQRQLAERSRYVASLGAVDGALANAEVSSARRLLGQSLPELRGWEWRHLALACDPSLSGTRAHQGSATAVAFNPGGTLAATVGLDGRLELWDPSDGSHVVTIHDAGFGLSTVAFSPDGQHVAAAGWDDRVLRWDLASGRPLPPLPLADDAEFLRDNAVTALIYSPDGTTLYAGTNLDHVVTFDTRSGARRVIRRMHTGAVTSLAVSPDGQQLVTGSADHSALLWDAARGEPLLHLFDHDSPVWAVAVSPTAPTVATGSGSGRVTVFDRHTGELLWQSDDHAAAITSLSFSPDGATLASGSGDRTLRLWDAHEGRALATLNGHRNELTSLVFDDQGGRLASVDAEGALHFWDTQDRGGRSTLSAQSKDISAFVAARVGKLAVSATLDGRLRVWDTAARQTLAVRELSHPGPTPLALSPDGSRLASGDGSPGRGRDHPLVLWDLSDPTAPRPLPRTLSGHQQAVVAVAFSPDGSLLASASRDRTVRVWDSESGLLRQALSGHEGQVLSLAFHPQRAQLVSGGFDESLHLWDTESGAELISLQPLGSQVSALAFSPDGLLLAVGAGAGQLSLRDAETLELLRSLPGHQGDLTSLAFHPSEPRLASAADDGTIRLWDTDDGAELLVLRSGVRAELGARGPSTALSFSEDGARLFASAGQRIDVYETRPPAESWELRRTSARRVAAADKLVNDLLDRHVDPRLVKLALRDESDLDPQLLADGLTALSQFGDDPEHLADAAWSVVCSDFANPVRNRAALRQARASQRLAPQRARFMSLLGMALYRVGEYREARGMFERAWSANVYEQSYPSSWDLYFLAMVAEQLSDAGGALSYLAQAQDVSASGLDDDHPATVTFAAEARRTLR